MTLAQNDVSATCERRKMTNDECRMTKEFQVPTGVANAAINFYHFFIRA